MLFEDFALQNTTTIYNSLDMPYIQERAKEPLPAEYQWLEQASPLCISMGRLIQQKGQWHLVRAFTKVVQAHPSAQLVVLGEGEYKAQLEQLVLDCGLEDSVHFIGKHANVYQFLQAADVFVFSSLFEGMPNTMLEALSIGLPIVSPDCPSGPREIIAPALPVGAQTTYPHETPYGILTTPFAITEAGFETPTQHSLTPEENQLAAAMNDMLKQDWKRGSSYTAYNQLIAEAFVYETIMQEWESLLS
jgi:glycosyltransferase involved in cell wall biosynthesis